MQHTDLNLPAGKPLFCSCGAPAGGTFAGKLCCLSCASKRTMTAQMGGPEQGRFEPFAGAAKTLPVKAAAKARKTFKDW